MKSLSNEKKIKLAILIRSLNYGGAQRQLVTLAKGLDHTRFAVTVIYFYPGGQFETELKRAGVNLVCLDKTGRWDGVGFFFRLFKHLRSFAPDVLLSYLDVANVVAVIARSFVRRMKIVWSIRSSNLNRADYDWLTSVSWQAERILSRIPDLIFVNSNAGYNHFVNRGYPRTEMVVVSNGIDTEVFRPSSRARIRIRSDWQIPANIKVIGTVGRLEPMKDQATLLRAAAVIIQRYADVKFVFVGSGQHYEKELRQIASQHGLERAVLWCGELTDMADVYNGFDLFVSTSLSEGFPNSVAEAMSCGLPCIVTDVGDSASIVGDTGRIVEPRKPEVLADVITAFLNADLHSYGLKARERILENFDADRLVNSTQSHLERIVERDYDKHRGIGYFASLQSKSARTEDNIDLNKPSSR